MSDLLVLNERLETIVQDTRMMKGSKCNADWFLIMLRMNFGKKEHGRKKGTQEGSNPRVQEWLKEEKMHVL